MSYQYCTLFDSGYLDKGLVLYESLAALQEDFHLYILAFDDITHRILTDLNKEHLTVITLPEFETDELRKIKPERNRAEYCWTCTPCLVQYVLETYGVDMCTYIDADMRFFSPAKPVFDSMEAAGASITITPHRFAQTPEGEEAARLYGRYCVEFNTFKNDANGLAALQWWKEQCLQMCTYTKGGGGTGDQRYLEAFLEKFDGVWVNDHVGAGVAPWNLRQYKLVENCQPLTIEETATGKQWPVVFYHFQNLRYIGRKWVNCNSQTDNRALKCALYLPYLREIEAARAMLQENYGVQMHASRKISSNPVIAWIQEYVMPFRVRRWSDLVNLKKVRKQ